MLKEQGMCRLLEKDAEDERREGCPIEQSERSTDHF